MKNKRGCMFFVIVLIIVYILENSSLHQYIDSRVQTYCIMPLTWLAIIFIMKININQKINGVRRHRKRVKMWAFNTGLLYIIVLVIAGFSDGFGKSPYNHSVKGILINAFYVSTMLVGRELIRSYIVNKSSREENYIILILVALLMTCTSIPFFKVYKLIDPISVIKFCGEEVLPNFAENILASYLVYIGGAEASIIYLGVQKALYWLSPLLPDLKWITKSMVGILYPVFAFMVIQHMYNNLTKQVRKKDRENIPAWIITCTVSVGIIYFAIGLLPIYPSVVATGSMEPKIYAGDVAILKKIGAEEVVKGDVIQFQRGNILISHRIIDIVEKGEDKRFRTKGDNNSIADSDLVPSEAIKGKVIHVVPKIGWLTLLFKSQENIDMNKIVF